LKLVETYHTLRWSRGKFPFEVEYDS